MYSKQLAPFTLAACLAAAVALPAVSPAQAATIHVDADGCPNPGSGTVSVKEFTSLRPVWSPTGSAIRR